MALPELVVGKEYTNAYNKNVGKYLGTTGIFTKKYKFDGAFSQRDGPYTQDQLIKMGLRAQDAAYTSEVNREAAASRNKLTARAEQQATIDNHNEAIRSAINRPPPEQTSIYGHGRRRRSTSKRSKKKKSHTRRRRHHK